MENLTDLIANVRRTIERTDLDDVMPNWVAMCEAELSRRLRVSSMERFFEIITDENGQATFPDDLLSIRNIEIDGINRHLVPASRAELDGFEQRFGLPDYYAMQGREVLLYPNPGAVIIQGRGVFALPKLEADVTSQALLKYPDLYLYGTLKHSAPFLMEDERLAVWSRLFDFALDGANREARKFASPVSPKLRPNSPVHVGYRR